MGADVHVVLGKINMQAIEDRRNAGSSTCTEIALFRGMSVDAEDFQLMDVPDEFDLNRNYSLFAWLANVRGDVKPIDPEGIRQAQTAEFIQWLDSKLIAKQKSTGVSIQGRAGYYDYLEDNLDIGDHSRIIHTVNYLRSFNYDQIAEVADEMDENYVLQYIRPLDGETYRWHFGAQYFKLLDFCHREGWHFILFGFDS